MKGIPDSVEGDITEQQAKRLRETRDCPDSGCSGHLSRVEVWVADGVVHERYSHAGGDDDCECAGGNSVMGRINRSGGIVASHHPRGRSKGHGCLRGEL